MRGVAAGLIGLALLGGLTGCSPGRNAVAAIGYDEQGRLIAAVQVCDRETVEATLTALGKEPGSEIGRWERSEPMTEGTETWPIRERRGGRWEATGAAVPALGPATRYQFLTTNENGSYMSNGLEFHGRDLMRLLPGELLVEREDAGVTAALEAITLDQLDEEFCVR
jgi:hypothetical protein